MDGNEKSQNVIKVSLRIWKMDGVCCMLDSWLSVGRLAVTSHLYSNMKLDDQSEKAPRPDDVYTEF